MHRKWVGNGLIDQQTTPTICLASHVVVTGNTNVTCPWY